jgi:acyl dehydratase
MSLDLDHLYSLRVENMRFSYTDRDTMLYALAVGLGGDPLNEHELPFLFEAHGPRVIPSMAVILTRTNIMLQTGADRTKALHGEQRLEFHRQLAPAGELLADARITDVIDKGPGKGALIYYETVARDAGSGEPVFTTGGTSFARADGGFGGPSKVAPQPHEIPQRTPDIVHSVRTRGDQALLYRLTGDRNPLHVDPALAKRAGFKGPILHGLCTYGIACRSVLETVCGYDGSRIRSFDVRFTAPVYPGETIVTSIWTDGPVVSFQCKVAERHVLALNHGKCILDIAQTG